MIRRLLTRVSILLLAAVLASSPAFALGGRSARSHEEPGLFAALWQLLAPLAPAVEKVRSVIVPDGATVEKTRGTIVPSGATVEGTSDDDGDGRGTIDPNG